MTARNRVTPTGDILAFPLRGAWAGNRGILHRGQDIVRFHDGNLWITCARQFRGRWQQQWQPHHYTLLFFHDEAVSFAAGHRPCAECRRPAYLDFVSGWAAAFDGEAPSAHEINRALHTQRLEPGTRRRRLHEMYWEGLPDGTFVRLDSTPAVIVGDHLTEWTSAGYGRQHRRPRTGSTTVITPPATVAVLRTGYPTQIDDSAY
jgi:hypothetical protein